MSEYQSVRPTARSQDISIDAGLRSHMTKVYGLMAVAMVITGLVAYAVGTSPTILAAIFTTPLKWIVIFAPLGVVFLFSAKINSMRYETAQLVFWAFAGLVGLSISYIFAVYTGISIAQTFFHYSNCLCFLEFIWLYNKKKSRRYG